MAKIINQIRKEGYFDGRDLLSFFEKSGETLGVRIFWRPAADGELMKLHRSEILLWSKQPGYLD